MARIKNVSASAKGRLVPQDIVKALSQSRGTGIDSAGLLAELIECWGGKRQFARDIFQEFRDGKAGGMGRQRILEMISRLVIVVTSQDIAKPKGTADMSEDELSLAVASLLERLGHGPGKLTAPAGKEAGPSIDEAGESR